MAAGRGQLGTVHRGSGLNRKSRQAQGPPQGPPLAPPSKVLELSHTAPPAGKEVFKQVSLWGVFHSQTTARTSFRNLP